jgi:LmbE family N-acetylglucosaminyl deacetylase
MLGLVQGSLSFFGAPDGELARLEGKSLEDLVGGLSTNLSRINPGTLFLPCRSDGSSEHDAAFLIVHRALERSGLRPRVLEYPVWSWWNPLLLARTLFTCRSVWRVEIGSALDAKRAAVASYVSQTLPVPPDTAPALPLGFASMFLGKREFFLER